VQSKKTDEYPAYSTIRDQKIKEIMIWKYNKTMNIISPTRSCVAERLRDALHHWIFY